MNHTGQCVYREGGELGSGGGIERCRRSDGIARKRVGADVTRVEWDVLTACEEEVGFVIDEHGVIRRSSWVDWTT